MSILCRTLLLLATVIMLEKTSAKTGTTKSYSKKFPNLVEFFKKKPDVNRKYKLSKCESDLRREHCIFRIIPKRKQCLILGTLISQVIPQYESLLNTTEISFFKSEHVVEFHVNTCSRKITFKTFPNGKYILIPRVMEFSSVEAGIGLPIPYGEFQLFGAGEWVKDDVKFKMKFNKENSDRYSVLGYSEIDHLPIDRIGRIFDVDILPNDAVSVLLKKMNMDTLLISNCKIYGYVQPYRGNYELAFSGSVHKDFPGGHVRVFITKVGGTKNLAILLELQDFSPVSLLKKMYGTTINRVNILRDRNQTIALYISSLPTSKFSNTYTSHGSSRWIHRESQFPPGAFLLVTLPFPKRKALDMKIQLLPDGLYFRIPENENLSGDLILDAISPKRIVQLDDQQRINENRKANKKYSKMKILIFRYFLYNDTYLAAAESHLSTEEELEDLMPKGRPEYLRQNTKNPNYYTTTANIGGTLDTFFTSEEMQKDQGKRAIEKKNDEKSLQKDVFTEAEELGLL